MTKSKETKNTETLEVVDQEISPKELESLRKELMDIEYKKLDDKKAKIKEKIDNDLEKKAASLLAKRKADRENEAKLEKAKEIDEKIAKLREERNALGLKKGGSGGVSGPRAKSLSGNYDTIKSLIYEKLIENYDIPYDDLDEAVHEEFPTSKFDKSQYSWYRTKFRNG